MGRLLTESGTSLAIVAANRSEITYFPFTVGAESLVIDTYISSDVISTNTLSANTIVGKWEGDILQSYQVNVEGIDIKATGVPPNRYLKTNEQGIVAWVEESKSSLDDIDDLDVNNNLTVKGYISAQGNLSANDIDAQSNILSAGVNLLDIFTSAGGSVAGSGTTNKVTKWTNSTTVGDSNISDNGSTVTIAADIASGNLLNITNDDVSKFSVSADGSTTIQGNLSVHGDMHYIDTLVTVTSALSIINSGTGPGLTVEQKGADEPIAHFIDKEGGEIMFDDTGQIGIGIKNPDQKLTVVGGISASEGLSAGNIYSDGRVGINTNKPDYMLDVAGSVGIGACLIHNGDDDTFIHFTDDDINIQAGGVNFIDITQDTTNEITFNEAGADVDFRAEGDSDTHLLFVDAGNDKVGIGTDAPDYKLHVAGTMGVNSYIYHNGDADTHLLFGANSVNLVAGGKSALKYDASSSKIILNNTNANVDVQIMADDGTEILATDAANNRVGINTTSPGEALTVAGGISAGEGLSAKNIDSAYNILSAGTDLIDIFAPASGGGYIDGSGTANTVAKFSDSNTIADSCIADDGTTVTVSAPLSGDDFIRGEKFCLGANSRIDNPSTNNLGLYANNELGLELVSDTRVCSHHDLTVSGSISACSNLSAGGRFFAPNGSATAPTFSFSDFPGTGLLMADTDTLGIATRGSLRMAVDESGNVGIGEASPPEKLTVDGNIRINGNSREFYFAGDQAQIRASSAATDITFVNSSTELVRFASDGNVGIGVTDPGVALTIQGGISASGGLSAGNLDLVGGSGTTNFIPKFADPDTLGDSIAYVGSDNINIEGGLSALQGLSADNNICGGGCINYFVNNVGINIPNPSYKLTVQGSISSSNKGVFDQIGIGGICNPEAKLTVQGNISADGTLSASGDIDVDGDLYLDGNIYLDEDQRIFFEEDQATWIETDSADRLRFVAGGKQMLLLDQDTGDRAVFGFGTKVGINVGNNTTPASYLTVAGDISASEGLSAGKTSYFADKVGIGITNPGYALTIDNGDLLVCTNNGGYFQVDESANAVKHSDCVIAMFGTNNDLQIQHDSANSYISENGTGDLYITTNDASVYIQDANSGRIMLAAKGGSGEKVELNHSGSKKFETTSSGVTVTGDATINGSVTASGGLSANNLDSAFKMLSAGTDLTDIFGPGGSAGNVDGSGTACYLPVWSDSNTIANSIACQSTNLLTVQGSISAHGALSATNSTACSYFAGNVGIGTTAPGSILELQGDGGNNKQLRLASGSSAVYWDIGRNYNTGHFEITEDSGSTYFLIDKDNGNVGIGTATPGAKLAVQGAISASGNLSASELHIPDYPAGRVRIGNSDDLQLFHSGSLSYIRDMGTGGLHIQTDGPAIYLQDADGNPMAQFTDGGNAFLYAGHALKFNTSSTGVTVAGDATINGSVTASDGLSANNLDSAFNIISAGTDLTDIFGPGGTAGNINGSGTACYLPVWSDTDTIGNSIAFQSSTILSVAGTISSRGYCSVGTDTIFGTQALNATSTGGQNTAIGLQAMLANTSGYQNVAVGEAALTSNTEGLRNTAVGCGAAFSNTTGDNNVAIGCKAGYSNQTSNAIVAIGTDALYNNLAAENVAVGTCAANANTTGTQNTALGHKALCSNTIGTCNVAIGFNALMNSVTACGNVAIGNKALCKTTCGEKNVAVGDCALQNNTEAWYNVGVGYAALQSNTTGEYNVSIGRQALNANTTGCANIGLGRQTLWSNISGGCNVAIGHFAMNENTTGGCNVALGLNALYKNTSGQINNVIGMCAMYNNTTGFHNEAIGYLALCSNTEGSYNAAIGREVLKANTTGTCNIGIGYRALCKNTTASCNIAIGRCALHDNTTGTENVAVGQAALNSNDDGNYLVAVGSKALCSNTCESYSTAVGHETLMTSITACHNTAVGFRALCKVKAPGNTALGSSALRNATGGTYNMAIGYQTLFNNTDGTHNTAVGERALYSTNIGTHNTGLGSTALYGNTTGLFNVGIGVNAGCNNQDGDCNTFMGYAAGRYLANGSTNLTSPDNSTYIGSCTRGAAVSDSNVTVIGYCACSCGDNTVSIGNGDVTDTYINGCTSVVGDISASGNGYFTCVIAGGYFEEKAAHPSLAKHPTGSLVVIGQDGNLTLSTRKNDKRVFGVTQKGACQPIILGAEPVLVTGNIKAGDFITTSDKLGHGMKSPDPIYGSIIAQSMEDGAGDSYLVRAMIRKM